MFGVASAFYFPSLPSVQTQPCCCCRLCSPPSSTRRWRPFSAVPSSSRLTRGPSSSGSETTSEAFLQPAAQPSRKKKQARGVLSAQPQDFRIKLSCQLVGLFIDTPFLMYSCTVYAFRNRASLSNRKNKNKKHLLPLSKAEQTTDTHSVFSHLFMSISTRDI